jgi:MFS family permease
MDQTRPGISSRPASWIEIFRGRLGVYTLLLNFGILFFGIDGFLVNTMMPTIVADIGGVAYYAWATMLFVVGAIVGSAGYGPLRARLGGRKSLALGGLVFTLAALGCSVAPHMAALLVARLFQGLGGGVIVAGAMAFVSALYEPRLRTRAIAFTSLTWIGCAVIGPIEGGIFAELGWWRGAFWLYVPMGAAFLAGVWWKIPESSDRSTAESRALRFPIWRLALLAAGVMCVGSAGRVDGEALRLALIAAAGLIVWYAFARDAAARNRLFPSRPLSLSSLVGLGYWVHIMITAAYTAVSIFLPLVLAVIFEIRPLYVGVVGGMMSIGWSVSSALVAGLHGGRERISMAVGPFLMLIGCAGLAASASSGGSLAGVAVLAVLIGLGIGCIHVHITAKVMAAAEAGEESITASSLSTIRSLGMAFGSAIAGTIANVAGLEAVVTFEAVSLAATGVYLFTLVPLAFAAAAALRFIRLSARPAAQLAE